MKEFILSRLDAHKILIRYVIAGGTAFCVEYGTFYVLYYGFHWRLIIANGSSFLLGLLVSFMMQRFWTFASKDKSYSKHMKHQAILYFLLSAFNLGVSTLIIETLVHASLRPFIAKFGTQLIIAVWNFFILKRIIFTQTV